MLRRSCAIFPLGATRRNFSTTIVFRIAANGDRMSPETARKVKDEDKADLERERKLREQFASKILKGTFSGGQQQSTNNAGGGGASGEGSQQQFAPPFALPAPGSMQWKLMRVLFFGFSIYLIFTVSSLQNPSSPLMMMQGQPWWQVPPDVLVVHTLLRSLVSFREQRRIKSDYETACKQSPSLTLTQFLSRANPTILAGHRTSQAEITAALMAAHSITQDLSFVDTVAKAVRAHPRDPKAAVDNIMELLRTDVPQIFAPMVPNPNWQQPAAAPPAPWNYAPVSPPAHAAYGGNEQPPNDTHQQSNMVFSMPEGTAPKTN